MPSNTQNNVDIEEGLAAGFPTSNTTTVSYGTGLELSEGIDIEEGRTGSPTATQNVTGSSPFTLASTQIHNEDDSSPANTIASNYAAAVTAARTQLFATDESSPNHAAAAATERPVAVMTDTPRFGGAVGWFLSTRTVIHPFPSA